MKFALLPLAVSLAAASPVWNNVAKRQASSVLSEASSAIASATSVVESATSAASSAASSAVAVPSSAMSSMMMSSAAPSASASASDVPGYALAYPCPDGTQLVYAIQQQTYPGVTVAQAAPLLNFSSATWYGVVNATGDEIGATRNVQFPGLPVTLGEVLVNQTTDAMTGAIQQTFNGTTPIDNMGITLASYSTVLQFYNNDTEAGAATAKIFTNACTNPQSVQTTLDQLFQAALAALGVAVTADNASSIAASSAPSSAVASSAVASATSGVASSVADAASSITAAASSLAASASDIVASAVPSV